MKYRLLTLTNRGIRGQRDGEIRYCMCEVRDQTVGDRLVNKINTHLYVFFSLFCLVVIFKSKLFSNPSAVFSDSHLISNATYKN